MRSLLTAVLMLVASTACADRFVATIAIVLSLDNAVPAPPPNPSGICENCNGTGKLGDGTVFVPCPLCGGDGKINEPAGGQATRPVVTKAPPAVVPDSLPADQQPTPMAGVTQTLDALAVRPDEVLVDFGCGYDARFLITAARRGVKRCIGVEIDPAIADSARRYVAQAGLSDRIEIITGDAREVDVQADVGVAYLWPDTLRQLRTRIQKLDRFASYGFGVPGLQMNQLNGFGKVYVWTPEPVVTRVPIMQAQRQTVRLPRGSYCQVCGRNCSNPMAHKNVTRIVGYRDVPTVGAAPAVRAQQPTGRWVTRKVCVNGRCSMQRVWQAY